MAALGLTIPSANGGSPLVFTVKGLSLGNEATAFSQALAAANPLTINVNSPSTGGASASAAVAAASNPVTLNEVFTSSAGSNAYTIAAGNEYTAVLTGVPTTVTGSTAGGDTVIATGGVTYNAVGSNNNVAFMFGEDVYNGSKAAGVGGDTVTGSQGFDTVNTGYGNTTVFGGYGATQVNLNDTVGNGDLVYLGDGHGTVNANGVNDIVVTAMSGQQIIGGGDTVPNASTLSVVIGSRTENPNFTGNDTVVAGAARTNVFDSIGGNTIFGGSGQLDFVGEQRPGLVVGDTIFAGTGSTAIFAAQDNNLVIGSASGTPVLTIIAGLGNETLNGANAAGGADFFFKNNSADTGAAATADGASPINDSVTGGNFYNFFQTGSGNESITGGTGENIFGIGTVTGGATITISDFAQGALNYVNLLGETTLQIQAVENSAKLVNGNLQLTLSDSSTVTFVGLNNIDQLKGHIVGG